jgi:hypothetical protein
MKGFCRGCIEELKNGTYVWQCPTCRETLVIMTMPITSEVLPNHIYRVGAPEGEGDGE